MESYHCGQVGPRRHTSTIINHQQLIRQATAALADPNEKFGCKHLMKPSSPIHSLIDSMEFAVEGGSYRQGHVSSIDGRILGTNFVFFWQLIYLQR